MRRSGSRPTAVDSGASTNICSQFRTTDRRRGPELFIREVMSPGLACATTPTSCLGRDPPWAGLSCRCRELLARTQIWPYGQSIANERVDMVLRVGLSVTDSLLVPDPLARRRLLTSAADAGLDHITVGDHISFHGGTGFDGMVSATSVLAAHDTLSV